MVLLLLVVAKWADDCVDPIQKIPPGWLWPHGAWAKGSALRVLGSGIFPSRQSHSGTLYWRPPGWPQAWPREVQLLAPSIRVVMGMSVWDRRKSLVVYACVVAERL